MFENIFLIIFLRILLNEIHYHYYYFYKRNCLAIMSKNNLACSDQFETVKMQPESVKKKKKFNIVSDTKKLSKAYLYVRHVIFLQLCSQAKAQAAYLYVLSSLSFLLKIVHYLSAYFDPFYVGSHNIVLTCPSINKQNVLNCVIIIL